MLPILDHVEVAAHVREIVLYAPELAEGVYPGQFVHVLCGNLYDPLLRRPFSIHDADPSSGRVSLLYEIRGRGTAALAEKLPGETLDVLGPLGQGFTLPESSSQPLVLIAGGMGVAPLYYLARKCLKIVQLDQMTFMVGMRTWLSPWSCDLFARLGPDVTVSSIYRGYFGPDIRAAAEHGRCSDEYSVVKGFATRLLEDYIEEMGVTKPLVYACGPMPMLKAVAEITKAHGLKCQVSTEAKMACGIGACMSCVIKVRSGRYLRCCKEGPVFDAEEVIW